MEDHQKRSSSMEKDGKYPQKFVSVFCERNGFQNGSFPSYTDPDCMNIANKARKDFKTQYQWIKKNWFRKHIEDYGTSSEVSESVGRSSSSDQNRRRNLKPVVGYARSLACNQFSGLAKKVHREVYLAALLKTVTVSQSNGVQVLNYGEAYLTNGAVVNEELRDIPSTSSETCGATSRVECYSQNPLQVRNTMPARSSVPNATETETSKKPTTDVITDIMDAYEKPLQAYAPPIGDFWPPVEQMGVDSLEIIDCLLKGYTTDPFLNSDVDLRDV